MKQGNKPDSVKHSLRQDKMVLRVITPSFSTLTLSTATNSFSVGVYITETCLPLHNTHLRTALHFLSRCPGFRHAKQHPLLTTKFLFSTKLELCALGQDSLVCDPSQKTQVIFPDLQLTRPAVVGIALLLQLSDSVFCGLAPLALPSRLKPRIAMLILFIFYFTLQEAHQALQPGLSTWARVTDITATLPRS